MESTDALSEQDLDTLDELASASGPPAPGSALAERATRSWERARHLCRQAADASGHPGMALEIWPWRKAGAVFPFVWARFKKPTATGHASHVGLFLSNDGCNCCLDLEKDLLDAGESEETLADVMAFYRDSNALPREDDPDLRVWTDEDNVLSLSAFRLADLDEFMAANQDEGHPWPRIGYRFDPQELIAAPDGQIARLGAWLGRLQPFYGALLAHVGDGS